MNGIFIIQLGKDIEEVLCLRGGVYQISFQRVLGTDLDIRGLIVNSFLGKKEQKSRDLKFLLLYLMV